MIMPHWKKRETVFSEYGFQVKMPGYWQLRPTNDPVRWQFRSADHKEQLTVARGEAAGSEGGQAAMMRRAVTRNRRAVELGFGRVPDLELSEPEYGEQAGAPAGWYDGTAGEGSHRFRSLLLFSDQAVWSLFYESFKLSEADAETRGREILESAFFSS